MLRAHSSQPGTRRQLWTRPAAASVTSVPFSETSGGLPGGGIRTAPPSPVQALLGGPSRRLLNVRPLPVRRFLGCTTLDTSLSLFTPPSSLTKRAPCCAQGEPANPDVPSPSPPEAPFTEASRNAPRRCSPSAPGSGRQVSRCYLGGTAGHPPSSTSARMRQRCRARADGRVRLRQRRRSAGRYV